MEFILSFEVPEMFKFIINIGVVTAILAGALFVFHLFGRRRRR